MLEIKAYIQPFMLDKVEAALKKLHIHGISVCDVRGFGREKDESFPHYYQDYVVEFTPKIKIEIVCPDEDVDKIVDCIYRNAHTGRRGDGKIFVTRVLRAKSIRTGEEGEKAI
ncbi:MAG: P-II family nitrogen regulator [Chlorobi bacterium]|nr:P-II family nitrogen regulator [Chlorobiota bacterium]